VTSCAIVEVCSPSPRKRAPLALYLISYDIDEKNSEEYEPLWTLLEKWKAIKVLYSEWVVVAKPNLAQKIANAILQLPLKDSDRLLVQEVTQDAAWWNLKISDNDFQEFLTSAEP
jgi:CRISPR/Cas system-associated endoribonuclease Cas2